MPEKMRDIGSEVKVHIHTPIILTPNLQVRSFFVLYGTVAQLVER